MVIRHLINSDEDIIRLFGKRFLERLQVLVRMYNEKYKDITHTTAVKLANVALGFCLAASGGERLTCQDYEAMLYGHSQECLTLDDMPMMLDEEDWKPTEGLIWDATCLMLEEEEALPQVAYDIADRHVKYAYNPDIMVIGSEVAEIPQEIQEPVLQKEDAHCFSKEMVREILHTAELTGDIERVKSAQQLIMDNIMQNCHADVLAEFKAAEDRIRKINEKPTIGEYVAQKFVTNEINGVAAGGVGIVTNGWSQTQA